ncbi:MAG: hypothetical protein IJM79_03050 [Erysipelotrichaceae bacterium]|nr:hypothetical protein [Erysipelotrichaceae bacterium]
MTKAYENKTFVSSGGTVLGSAVVPADFSTGGGIDESWQGEMVPFKATMNAGNPGGTVFLRSTSKDVHTDLRNPLLKTVAALVAVHTEAGYDRYTEPEEYIRAWAENWAGVPLKLDAVCDLPSALGGDRELARGLLENDKNLYDQFLEMNSGVDAEQCFSSLYRFTGQQQGADIVVLAGMDWQCARLTYGPAFLNNFSDEMKKLYAAAREKLGLKGDSDYLGKAKEGIQQFKETASKMTFSDYMKGGILAKMKEQKKPAALAVEKENQAVAPVSPEREKRCDLVLWGSQRRYGCLMLANEEAEATPVFLNFVRSVSPDGGLDSRESNAINRKFSQIRQQASMNMNIAMQKTAQLRAMQARTSQMIARNADQAREGLADSWKRKMASDDHISQGYHEAAMGVNSYTNSYGQNVEVGVAADHVYENQYGDVYGVSGNALDQETLNDLNWKKIG